MLEKKQPINEPVHPDHSKVYISIPEKRPFIISKSEDNVYVHYLSPVSTTEARDIWWDVNAGKYYAVCEIKLLLDQESIFYIFEPAGKPQIITSNVRCGDTPTFVSKATINPILQNFQYHHCEFDASDEHDEVLSPLTQNERAAITALCENEAALIARMEELAQINTDDCDDIPLSRVVHRASPEHEFLPLLSRSSQPITPARAPLVRLKQEICDRLPVVDLESLRALDALHKVFANDTHQYCALLHRYIMGFDAYRRDDDYAALSVSLDSWVGRSHDIRATHHYGNPDLPLPLLMAEKKKQLKYILATEIQQHYPNYSLPQRVMRFDDLKGYMKHVETNHNALIKRLAHADEDASAFVKDSARAHFASYVLNQVRHILEHEKSQDRNEICHRLRQLLYQAWDIVNGTPLSYNAQPNDPVNHLLYSIAAYTAEPAEEDQDFVSNVLKELIPGTTEYCVPEVSGRHISDVANVFRTHLFCPRVNTLVPLTSVIDAAASIDDATPLQRIRIQNRLGDLDPDKTDQHYLSFADVAPAFSHSETMRRLRTLRDEYDLTSQQDPIVASLLSLISYLSHSSASELGHFVETRAEELVYAGLPEKLAFYIELTLEQRAKFPQEVKQALDHFIMMTENFQARETEEGLYGTCLDLRTEEIRRAVANNQTTLNTLSKELDLSQDKHMASVASKLSTCAQELHKDIREGRYAGADQGNKSCGDINRKLEEGYKYPNPVQPCRRWGREDDRAARNVEAGTVREHWTDSARRLLNEVAEKGIPEMESLVNIGPGHSYISPMTLLILGIDSLLESGRYESVKDYFDRSHGIDFISHRLSTIGLGDVFSSHPSDIQRCRLRSNILYPEEFGAIVHERVRHHLEASPNSFDHLVMRDIVSSRYRMHRGENSYKEALEEIATLKMQKKAREVTSTYKIILQELRVSFRARAYSESGKHSSDDGTVTFRNKRDKIKDADFGRLLAKNELTKNEVEELVSRSTTRHIGIFGKMFAPTTKREFAEKACSHPVLS